MDPIISSQYVNSSNLDTSAFQPVDAGKNVQNTTSHPAKNREILEKSEFESRTAESAKESSVIAAHKELYDAILKATKKIPLIALYKVVDGKIRIQLLQGEFHTQNKKTAVLAKELRQNFPVKMLEGLGRMQSPIDRAVVKLATVHFKIVMGIPKLLPFFFSNSGIHEETLEHRSFVNNGRKPETKIIPLEKGYQFSYSERFSMLGISSMSSALPLLAGDYTAKLAGYLIPDSRILESIENVCSYGAGFLTLCALSSFGASTLLSVINRERKYMGKLPFEFFALKYTIGPLISRRNENFAKSINNFWERKPVETSAVAVCGMSHLPGTADALIDQGWTELDW